MIVDTNQNTHKIMHVGIVYRDRNLPQAPTIIPPIPMSKV
jgi:hypothetical protein